jgi:hypothetical protein
MTDYFECSSISLPSDQADHSQSGPDGKGIHMHEGFYSEDDLMNKLYELSQSTVDDVTPT